MCETSVPISSAIATAIAATICWLFWADTAGAGAAAGAAAAGAAAGAGCFLVTFSMMWPRILMITINQIRTTNTVIRPIRTT